MSRFSALSIPCGPVVLVLLEEVLCTRVRNDGSVPIVSLLPVSIIDALAGVESEGGRPALYLPDLQH